jgi:pseudaminic acid cytidylyltransferase
VTRICIIPARGGSVRIPRKNIKFFRGKPIIHYSIDVARKSKLFTRIVVSTDDQEIAVVAAEANAEVYMREYDDGTRGTQEVAAEVLRAFPGASDEACVIYPTCPLLRVSDLERGFAVLQRLGALYAMSVSVDPLADAGSFYCGQTSAWLNKAPLIDSHTVMVPMPANRVCDINTDADWKRAEELYDALRRAHGHK